MLTEVSKESLHLFYLVDSTTLGDYKVTTQQ